MNQPSPIEALDTNTTAFIGQIPGAAESPGAAHRCESWQDFTRVARLSPNSGRSWNDLAHAVHGFFLNGGRRCIVVEGGEGGERELAAALATLDATGDVRIVAAPGLTEPVAYEALTAHCEARRDRMAIFDGPAQPGDAHLKVMAGDATEAPDGWRMPPSALGYTAFYTPWLRVADPEAPGGATLLVPPSGHIAGAWAANDARRGVHKAPANLPVAGALDLSLRISESQQDRLNPRGVNALRVFPGRGVLIWGARTLSPAAEWRYVSVRRLMTMIATSICHGTGWVVFEPNDEPLWARLRAAVEDFLFQLWRGGALAGMKPEQAFFVRCDRTTMTQNDIDNGRLIVLIGVAVMRPAEFHIFRVSPTAGGCDYG